MSRLHELTQVGQAIWYDYIRRDEVEVSWRMIDSITTAWRDMPANTVSDYPAGAWGPEEADDLIQNDGRQWANP